MIRRSSRDLVLVAGGVAFVLAFGGWLAYLLIEPKHMILNGIDLDVYRDGGLIVRHARGYYDAGLSPSPLYGWTRSGRDSLRFTYTPFAAISFVPMSLIPQAVAKNISLIANMAAIPAAIWFTLGGLGYARDRVRAGATLLSFAAVLWTEPVMRTLYLGQVNLVLVALIMWDLCQPDSRRNKGFATGIAAGVKLVPLIFVPYLLATRKFRQAATAIAGFAVTVVVGFVVLPDDSAKYWFDGLFFSSSRTGFAGWEGNQSLDALLVRLAGSINAAKPFWLAAAVLTVTAGLYAATRLYRAGHQLPALLLTGLTGDLISPISWDHHWVWLVPGAVVCGHYAVTAWRNGKKHLAWAYASYVVFVLAVFACWPGSWLHTPKDAPYQFGLIWLPPQTSPFGPDGFYAKGDQAWFYEYHWHGPQLVTGNAYVLTGIAVFAVLFLAACLCCPAPLTARDRKEARRGAAVHLGTPLPMPSRRNDCGSCATAGSSISGKRSEHSEGET